MRLFRRRVPSFAMVSLPRCGSTALFRALGTGTGVRIAYEPDFGEAWRDRASMAAFCSTLFSTVRGIKHVWDPNGWPFANKSHRSTPEVLAGSEQWIAPNAALLDCVEKVVFLRRRNRLARTVSDLLGQQTDLWGHDPARPHSAREAADHRDRLAERELAPLDEEVVEWYLDNAAGWQERIVAGVPDDRILAVWYEDLFGAEVDLETRLARVAAIGDWLGIRLRTKHEKVRAILQPASKANDAAAYARIPNYRELTARFGEG